MNPVRALFERRVRGFRVVHLLAAGAWLGALVVLWPLTAAARRGADRAAAAHAAAVAFSGVGVGVTSALLASGLVNAWFLLGPDRWRELATDPWGRLLLLKLVLFAAMLVLAGLNRWRWTPALAAGPAGARVLARSVAVETALGLLAVTAAALMGGLAPPASQP